MKITSVSTETYQWPLVTPISNGKHTYTDVTLGLLMVETDTGLTGIALGGGHPIVQSAIEHFAPQLLGQDPVDVERLWHELWVPKLVGRRGMTTRAISVIDIALWDLRAKHASLPLYKLIGGARDRVETYIAGGYYEKGKGLPELAEEMRENVAMGARAIKMKVGALSLRDDVERVRVVRSAIGPDVKLMVDANCAYKVHEAIQFATRIEEFDPFWFEEPIAVDDYEGHRRLSEATTIPVATGENEYTRYGFRDLIERRAAAILNPDAVICGGITEFLKIAHLAQAFDVDIAPHGPQEIHVHLVAGLANGLILEYYRDTVDPMWGKAFRHTLTLNEDGTVTPPDSPGIGIDPDYDVLAPHRVSTFRAGLE